MSFKELYIVVMEGLGKDINLTCSSDDSDDDIAVNPLVAGDEDIDSEEEDEPEPDKPVAVVADTKPVTDDEEEEDDEGDSAKIKFGISII